MKTLIFIGGLGNQMFEYAFLLALRRRMHLVLMDISYYDFFKMHNGYELNRVFGINEKLVSKQGLHIMWLRLLNKIKPSFLYTTDTLKYNPECLTQPRMYIRGYWQDERYFKDIESDVREAFHFKHIDDNNEFIATEMRNCNSVSLHIRRGDYAAFGMSIIGADYYCRAIEHIKENVSAPVFYIFSDDVNVAESLVKSIGIEYKLITHNTGNESYKDMYLMSQCRHNIIANSSFSWWGAWLNENDKKIVIAPKIWEADKPYFHPQPDGWILL